MVVIVPESLSIFLRLPAPWLDVCNDVSFQTHSLVLRQRLSVALESPILGVWAPFDIQFYAGVLSPTVFSFLIPPPFLFIFVNLFVEVESWPRKPQHLSVGEGVGGNKCIFRVTALLTTQNPTSPVGMDTCESSSPWGQSPIPNLWTCSA